MKSKKTALIFLFAVVGLTPSDAVNVPLNAIHAFEFAGMYRSSCCGRAVLLRRSRNNVVQFTESEAFLGV